jgi:hypothetical protein
VITFKQFLEEVDPLEHLQVVMFFRKELGMTPAFAKQAAQWYVEENVAATDALNPHVWENILEYLERDVDPNIRKVSSAFRAQLVHDTLRIIMRNKYDIADMRAYTRKHRVTEEQDPLHDLEIQMAMRKEFGLNKQEAVDAAEWIKGDMDAWDLDCWDKIWGSRLAWESKANNMGGNEFREYIFSQVCMILLNKYGVEL